MKDSYKILVELDALLDTRLGTLASIDIDIANEIGQSEKYYNRYSDVMSQIDSRIDDKVFRDRYLKRNVSVLQNSLMTDVIHLVCIGLESMMDNVHRGILPKDVRVHINTYPYKIERNLKDLLEAAVLNHIPYEVAVSTVSIDYYNLTPGNLKANYRELYIYDIEPWIEIHKNTILDSPMTDIQIVLPKLSTSGNDPTADSFDMEPFLARELLFKPYLSLNYIDLKYFTYNHGFTEHIRKSGFYDRR